LVRLNKTLEQASLEQASTVLLERRGDGQLWAIANGASLPVRVHRCFPWSEPDQYLSLRDGENREVALVTHLDELEAESREALAASLLEAGFVLRVTSITEVEEEVEIRTWKVETEQGPRSFQTKLDDWPWDVPGGGIVIRDVAGDLYHIADPAAMDEKSRKWLWAFVG
jgi:hypothetical protein